jgi:tetratricopeptide (TPR) repeat protein
MKSRVWAFVLASMAAAASGSAAEGAEKPAEPFYRKYLVPGNRLDDLILDQEKRVEASPDDASLRNDFGNLLAERRFPHEAAEQYEIAARLDKSNFISLYNLGLLCETEGKISRGIRAYRRSIDRKRGFPQAHFRLGRLYEHTGQNEEAVREYSQALWIDRSMRDPRRNPLVVDSELLYQASLANYSRDVASASMARESLYVEESRFRAVPVDRAVSYQEAAGEDESDVNLEPRQIGSTNAAGSATEGAGSSGRRTAAGTRAGPQDPNASPLTGRQRSVPAPRKMPRGGTPLVAAPPGTSVPPAVEAPPRPVEPEAPPEAMPEPTPAVPVEEEEPS